MDELAQIVGPLPKNSTVSELSGRLCRVHNTDVCSALSALLSSKPLVERVAARSYKHANGFDKIVLKEDETYKLRMHVWWTGEGEVDGDIHNHNWDFSSLVLIGCIRTVLYRQGAWSTQAGLDRVEYRYAPNNEMNYLITEIGLQRLQEIFTTVHQAGSVYAMEHQMIHTAVPAASAVTATLVLQTQTLSRETSVFVPVGREKQCTSNSCEPFTEVELRSKLKRIIRLINND